MASEYTYSPRMDFFIERVDRATGFEMPCFHIHHKYEIYYEIEGTRRYFIEDAAYIVNAGSVVLIGDNQIHKTASVGDTPSSRIVLNFSAEYLGKIAEIFPEVDFFSFLSEEHNHLLSNITVKQQNHIYSMLQAQGGESGRVSNHIVEQIQTYIAEHYAEKLTLTGIASQFYISPYYLSRLFKKSINLSLIEYINGVRIKAAQNLIEKTNESISDISEKTGFLTTAHFRRVFKDATGLSPQQYRQYYKRLSK